MRSMIVSALLAVSALLVVTCAGCVAPVMRSTLSAPPTPAQLSELWEAGKTTHRWYVVRDIGTALGESGRIDPRRNDPDMALAP
jgi:hypothetical protein